MSVYQTPEEALDAVKGITSDNYHDWRPNKVNCLLGTWSKSELHFATHNPFQFHAEIKKGYRACMKKGSLVDLLMTEGHKFESTYVVTEEEDSRKKGYLDAKKIAEAEGKEILKKKDLVAAEAMIEAVLGHPEGAEMARAQPQQVYTAALKLTHLSSGETGYVALKTKPDYIAVDGDKADVWDLKVTGVCSDDEIARIARNLGYNWQEHLYSKAISKNGIFVRSFKFVFVCSEPPHRVRIVEFDDEALAGAAKGVAKGFSTIWALGHGALPSELESPRLLLGRKRDSGRSWWDTSPDLHPELMVAVE